MDFINSSRLLAEQAVADLAGYGRHLFETAVDPRSAIELLNAIRATRRFDASLFLSEDDFDADPQHVGVNPRPGRNLLDRLEEKLGFVEAAPQITGALSALLGPDYRILNRKVVCGVPAGSVPPWLRARIDGAPVNNLGAYVRPQMRDITYFYGIDFHQDLIDFKDREADLLTLYVYLHPVGLSDAPLHLLEGSHRLGASVFPHDLQRTASGAWRYRNGAAGEMEATDRVLTGETGFTALWHACTLHGTQPDAADHERISLRYLFVPGPGGGGRIAEVNAQLSGALSLDTTRRDLDSDGCATMRQNAVNGA